ncbi:TadE/TadG family type IV pilus assembly protein [Brevundimonas sp. FT23028]|uniref:TadE/TadG family type IV pilus assembly protein n=1 Tax=Brevundimonas sp. FT23028 TaxID=3393748 RepID=UPI003B585E76
MTRPGLLRRFAGDDRGISAVEFALLAPVLIAFYLGLSEFCQGYMAQKRMGHVASMVADLVAQEETVTTANLDDIFDIGGLIMKPFRTTTLKIRVSSVTRSGSQVRVDWSRGDGMTARVRNSLVTLPPDFLADGQSVIMSEATYDYDSPADYLMPGLTRFTHTYYLRPRTTDKTLCPAC